MGLRRRAGLYRLVRQYQALIWGLNVLRGDGG